MALEAVVLKLLGSNTTHEKASSAEKHFMTSNFDFLTPFLLHIRPYVLLSLGNTYVHSPDGNGQGKGLDIPRSDY